MISIFYGGFLFGFLALLIVHSPVAAGAAAEGLLLCGKQLVPALFPFFVVSNLLMGQKGAEVLALPLKPLTGLYGMRSHLAPLVLLLSWCGGYGVCAGMVREGLRRKQLSNRDAVLLLLLGTASSPGFTIGAVGGMLGNPTIGLYYYLACLTGNLSCGLVWGLLLPREPSVASSSISIPAATLAQAIQRGIQSNLTICGCVVFFRVVEALVGQLLGLSAVGSAFLSGLLEVSSGCAALAGLGGNVSVYGCCAALSLLSVSVLLQMDSLLEGQCSIRVLVLSRPLHLAVSLSVLTLLLRCFPQTAPVYSSLAPRLVLGCRTAPDTALLIFGMCCILLRLLQQKNRPVSDGS